MNHLDIAMICHQANKGLCEAQGDTSQRDWLASPEWQRDSAAAGVRFIAENPNAPDSATHDSWSAQKLADGWRYGSVKDADAKTHPCLVAFDELPPMQQAKDRLFKAVCVALLPYAEPASTSN